uniref:Retroviral polymerase SH3-like domain-containing protein n=1 Tax=Tanacetum cinerariifolium TaxID=118510 RepID=A0A6L2NHF3_TANCI|nr:hypothetical protein [Tanacetum cinerariifolium]
MSMTSVKSYLHKYVEQPGPKDHLDKFDAKAGDGYFLEYSFVSKAFRVFNTRRQQVKETCHVTFDESIESIRQYQVDSDVPYYIIPHGRSLTKLTQENIVPEVITLNEPDIPLTKDNKGKLIRSMAAKLIAASASECLFDDFLSEIEPNKVSKALKYLKGTLTLGLYYPKCLDFDLKGYSDSDYAGCNMDRKSTSAEAEYVATAGCYASILWMKTQLSDYDIHYKMVLCENYSSTKQVNSIQQLLAYRLITKTEVDIGEIIYNDIVNKLLNKSKLKYVSYPRFISCTLQVLLGYDYTQDVKFGSLHGILSNSNFTKDPSKVFNIELTAHMIVVNNHKDSVSPPPLYLKQKKGKSQTVTPTLPKSQGPEAFETLFKKRKLPKPKKTSNETKVDRLIISLIQHTKIRDEELGSKSKTKMVTFIKKEK